MFCFFWTFYPRGSRNWIEREILPNLKICSSWLYASVHRSSRCLLCCLGHTVQRHVACSSASAKTHELVVDYCRLLVCKLCCKTLCVFACLANEADSDQKNTRILKRGCFTRIFNPAAAGDPSNQHSF